MKLGPIQGKLRTCRHSLVLAGVRQGELGEERLVGVPREGLGEWRCHYMHCLLHCRVAGMWRCSGRW